MDKLRLLKAVFCEVTDDIEKCVPFVEDAISTLDEREQCVLQKRFSGMSLEATGKELLNLGGHAACDGISKERVRQIEVKALRKLRYPSRRKILRGEWTALQMINNSFELKKPKPPSAELLIRAEELKCVSIDTLELSTRAKHAMERAQISSVGDLILKTETEILGIKYTGRKTLNEIKEALFEMNLGLRKP